MNEVVGPLWESVLAPSLERQNGELDFAEIETAASEAAAVMALGHGPMVNEKIESFAERSRLAERWLQRIAAAARRGDEKAVRADLAALEKDHCDGCHTAAERPLVPRGGQR